VKNIAGVGLCTLVSAGSSWNVTRETGEARAGVVPWCFVVSTLAREWVEITVKNAVDFYYRRVSSRAAAKLVDRFE